MLDVTSQVNFGTAVKINFCLEQMLVERGLNPDLPDSKGSTPLKYALFRNHVDVVKYLISINCNVEVSDW